MKKLALTLFALALVVSFAGRSMAAGNADIQVSAEIVASCTIAQVQDMDFGALPAPFAGPVASITAGQVDVACPVLEPFTVAEVSGANDGACAGPHCVFDGAADYMAYGTDLPTAGVGTGMATPVTVSINGTLTTNYDLLPVGIYTDTLTVDVTP